LRKSIGYPSPTPRIAEVGLGEIVSPLLLDHPRNSRTDSERTQTLTRAPTSSQHRVTPLTYTGAQQNVPVCGHERLHA
ncbi:MAG: hypothetical protein AAB308_18185, partial [Nitrospirota bacterium]